ncbi:SprT-like family-domain-containing protein [Catenaria anguillulae PL171]|uniref:SprT-like family-domain-containing protein n=1 Tax=Catenaria anguillulae PL171 TaxID=765915 RepID=A0A1Y2I5D5_9FUNG|nr:SprT-like family-domain-containing protein [Catenaria anguillulae PL171]
MHPQTPKHVPVHEWQWTSVTLSLHPVPPAPPPTPSPPPPCHSRDHNEPDSHDSHNCQSHDENLARILAAQWPAEHHPLPLQSFASSSQSSASIPPSNLLSSSTHEADTDYASLSHLPADQVFASEGPLFDLHARFQYYNARYFHSVLSACEARWSTRMTLCAGQCHYHPASGYCSIRLSHPLLQYRPKQDCINTLLHEMIHAYLFITDGNDDHDGHGPAFHEWMHKLNKAEDGAKITVFHSFKDEVNEQRKHVWQCNGPCKDLPPFYGLVKRAMNRPPQKADWWFEKHARECGGTYEKIAGPEPKAKPPAKRRRKPTAAGEDDGSSIKKKRKVKEEKQGVKIDKFLVKEGGASSSAAAPPPSGSGGEVVDLTADSSGSDTEYLYVAELDSDDDDDIIFVCSSNP